MYLGGGGYPPPGEGQGGSMRGLRGGAGGSRRVDRGVSGRFERFFEVLSTFRPWRAFLMNLRVFWMRFYRLFGFRAGF